MSAELKASRRDATLLLTLSNPGLRNALHPDLYAAAIETLSTAERDDSLRAVVLTGAERYFSAGEPFDGTRDPVAQAATLEQLQGWIDAIRDCPKPVIAAVEGGATGAGFSLALACDLIVAGASAEFAMNGIDSARTPDGGATWFLARALPRQLAGEMLFSGKPMAAARLHELGIVNRLAQDGSVLDAALNWADDLAALPASAIEHIKALLRDAECIPLGRHFEAERLSFAEALRDRGT
jgi:enoyl-CoA hydratase/carnithine racemase